MLELDGFISEHLRNLLVQVGLHISMHRVWYINPVMADEVLSCPATRKALMLEVMIFRQSSALSWGSGTVSLRETMSFTC